MKASLQLNIGQSLTLTPQLQQAIRLLQLSTVDLQQEIQTTLDSNPLLEVEEEVHAAVAEAVSANDSVIAADTALSSDAIPNELPLEAPWESMYSTTNFSKPSYTGDDPTNFDNIHHTTVDLREHLYWQLRLTRFSELDAKIANTIIEAIDNNGFLTVSLTDVRDSLELEADHAPVEFDEMEAVLHRIQQFDPVGVGARNLRECLTIQLNNMDAATPWISEAKNIISNYIDLLAEHNYQLLSRKTKLKQEELGHILDLIHQLNPRPGTLISSELPEYIIPDLSVRKINGVWKVVLNSESLPRLRINDTYASMIQRANNSPDNNFLRNNLQEARWFMKSIQSRNETLTKVARCIVKHQKDFLESGEEHMKPLVLNDVAQQIEMHESTVSRVTTQKYIHTPRGVFELKYFFSSHVSDGESSSVAIRAVIKKLIAAEDPRKPLSDNKISQILSKVGTKVARRTIAKYREALSIPPSNRRKSLI